MLYHGSKGFVGFGPETCRELNSNVFANPTMSIISVKLEPSTQKRHLFGFFVYLTAVRNG